MSPVRAPDWDPEAPEVLHDQRAAYDALRESCPVAYSATLHWSLFRHADVVRALLDPETFSNVVSTRPSVPNGMDPPAHTAYRRIIEPYFTADRMRDFEPVCRRIVAALLTERFRSGPVEYMTAFALPFAVQVQCEFLGWPPALHEQLREWATRHQAAIGAMDRTAISAGALEFERIVEEQHAQSRAGNAIHDVTTSLMREQVGGRPLSNLEVASILRNWTAGEIGTISAALGILVQFLADHSELQHQLRRDPARIHEAVEEILRLDGPLVSNRRVTTRAVEIGGRRIAAGERVSLMWMAANRDGRVFDDPYVFRWGRDPALNLLWGKGIHVCPGAPLARLELRICLEEILAGASEFRLCAEPRRAAYPAGGFSELHLRFE